MAKQQEGQETYEGDGIVEITSPEQLDAFIQGKGIDDEDDPTGGDGGDGGDGGIDIGDTGDGGAGAGAGGDGDGGAGDGGDGAGGDGDGGAAGAGTGGGDAGIDIGGKDPSEYPTALHYLNDRFKMNLNIPDDFKAEDTPQAIADIFGRLQQGVQAKIGEFTDVRQILEDQEVKDFIAAKKEGKTMKDYAIKYAQSTDGLSDEALIREELKVTMPGASDDDINKVVEGYRSSDTIQNAAEIMRKARKEREVQQAEQTEAQQEQQAQLAEQGRLQDVAKFGNYLKSVNSIYGVPLTDEMRNQVFTASTQLQQDGETYLEKALQSDEGILKATLGLLHLETLIRANNATIKNKARKNFADSLISDPGSLQSSSGTGQEENLSEEDAVSAINRM